MKSPSLFDPSPRFDGPAYDVKFDHERLTGQLGRVYDLMRDGVWWTLHEIANVTRDPQASISTQLRQLRRPGFGSYRVEKRRRGLPEQGLFDYRLVIGELQAEEERAR